MNAKQKKVAVALNVAGVAKDAKKPGPVIIVMPLEERVALAIAAFADWLEAESTLADAKAYWDIARMSLRDNLKDAKAALTSAKDWTAYLTRLRAELVSNKIVADTKKAAKLVNNQLIALNLTGQSTRKGGKRAGAGRKEVVAFKATKKAESDSAKLALVVAYCKAKQKKEIDPDILEVCGEILRIAR
jgi:hypothetical protein